ncbi:MULTISPECIES: energy transducer TonB family protein [Rhodobacterales]|jgi:protein TonB|uniref:energy transducer TonB family protein n=1 Tax=Rhodobacterales TaxID=204455 RepID=UPI00237FB642|nr:energy transducer TonB [Phaeobacter gallaeciensis]MDE4141929.1 energy transducer TonB [Phaeobacter gallaeciensis]MDE4150375.1 energy transducer TonB [Phaeobacter gallaeciensis]MDE4154783.1 energy transducer TonB [Phaeobacter gallaeciensis]MDE4230174.1 energy transducer TonB [Phaeobacter gallaeciensis]MDE4259067.1 energy transducer TonB [Phaeobacter gallaeciensis]
MSRLALFPACLASAALLHALPFVALPDGGTEAEGSGGTGQITLVAASAELTQQVSKWQRPQEITTQVPAVVQPAPIANPQPVPSASPSSVPDLPTSALAVLAPAAQAEAVPEKPAPPPPPPAPPPPAPPPVAPAPPAPAPPPKPAPAAEAPAEAKPAAASVAVNQQAAGSGQRSARGDNGGDEASTGNAARDAKLKRRWGAAILSRIERQMRRPRGGDQGKARVRLKVSTQGRLIGASVVRSSGSSTLDHAALQAAQKTRYPRAPKALAPGTYTFDFSPRFTR